MPEKCRVMTEDETEYEGGFWNPVSLCCTVASVGLSPAAKCTNNETLRKAPIVVGVASAVTSFGASTVALRALGTSIAKKEAAKIAYKYASSRAGIAKSTYEVTQW